jgi:molecular chaperone HscA
LQEARVDAERLLDATQTALSENGVVLLDPAERAAIDAGMDALKSRLSGTDHRAIKDAAEALNQATHEFAGRRMDASVKRALAGQRIEAL